MLAIKTLAPQLVIFRRIVRLMGERFEISVVGNDPGAADERIDDAVAEINRVEKLLSTFNDDSTVNEINRNAGIKPVKTSAEIFKLVDRCLQISALTYGAFDITYYNADPEADGLNTPILKAHVGRINYQNVVLDAKAQTVFLQEKGMRIGFGAINTGYAADRAKYILQLQGVSSGVINAGGNLLTWGAQPNNAPWTIATAEPDSKNMPHSNMDISNMAIATSAVAQNAAVPINKRQVSVTGLKKGFAVSGIKTVSILSTTAELAGAMASPVITIGINAGLYLINQLNQIACIITDDRERIYTSKGVHL